MQDKQQALARPMATRWTLGLSLILVILTASTVRADAQNLVVNGDFATDLSDWVAPFGQVEWSMFDASGDPDSGSLLLTDVGEFGAQFTQCIATGFTGPLEFSLSYFVPDEVVTVFTNGIIMFVTWYDDASCNSALESAQFNSGATEQGHWVRMSQAVMAPPGADSVRVWPLMIGSGSSDFTSHLDDIFVGDRLFSDGFE